jgi:hypothetical protein
MTDQATDQAHAYPRLERLTRVCALCNDKTRCRDELAAGTADKRYEEYCLNAPTIDRLGDSIVKRG